MGDVPNLTFTGLQHGACQDCGKYRYLSRRDAKRAARLRHPGTRMQAYQCGQYWHIGRNVFASRALARLVQDTKEAS